MLEMGFKLGTGLHMRLVYRGMCTGASSVRAEFPQKHGTHVCKHVFRHVVRTDVNMP